MPKFLTFRKYGRNSFKAVEVKIQTHILRIFQLCLKSAEDLTEANRLLNLSVKEQKVIIFLGILLVLGIFLRFFLFNAQGPAVIGPEREKGAEDIDLIKKEAVDEEDELSQDDPEAVIIVHVAGAVASPGIYFLEEGSRKYQALDMADGALSEAAIDYINLAQPLVDGQKIYVPTFEELDSEQDMHFPVNNTGESGGRGININSAGEQELQSLPGIGEVKAKSIISYREENGPFQRVEDLLQVSGIGEKTFEAIEESISVH